MTQLNDLIASNLAVFVGLLAAVYLLILLVVLIQSIRLRRLRRRLDALTRGADGRSLETVLGAHLDTVLGVHRELDALRARTSAIEGAAPGYVQRFALVRFNPFEDTGGNQSFALALLDGADNGIVVSSLHSRTGTRVYAKEIRAGKADTALSAEEAQALERAEVRPSGRVAARPVTPAAQIAPAPMAAPRVAAPPVAAPPVAAPPARNGGGTGEPAMDGGFLDRRLRGEDDDGQLWGDRSRS